MPFPVLRGALGALLLLSSPAIAQSEREEPTQAASSSSEPTNTITVTLTIEASRLTVERILEALKEEFGVDVSSGSDDESLQIFIQNDELRILFRDSEGTVLERNLTLPDDAARQLDSIALLAGNLARDEAGEFLASLRPQEAGGDAKEAPVAASPPLEEDNSSPAAPALAKPDEANQPSVPKKSKKSKPATEDAKKKVVKADGPPLRELPISVGIVGPLTFPKRVSKSRVHVHGSLFHSRIGNVKGVAGSGFLLHNRGLGSKSEGRGVQGAGLWLGGFGHFRGASLAGLAVTQTGGAEGVSGGGLLSYQSDNHHGIHLGGLASFVGGKLEGAQLGGLFAGTMGPIDGAQIGGVAAYAGGNVDGAQIALVGLAAQLDGTQIALVSGVARRMKGIQLGLINYSGSFQGAQIGLLNISKKGKGSQIGLLNISDELEGASLAPVSLIFGARNQLVSYVSFARTRAEEAHPAGPLTHVAWKVMPGNLYTQLSLGLGAESEECGIDTGLTTDRCRGNGVEYAPGFAVGGRKRLTKHLYLEVDGQYQMEKAFGGSSAHRHAILARGALGYEFTNWFSIFAGGGPRINIRGGARVEGNQEVTAGPHAFAGIQVL